MILAIQRLLATSIVLLILPGCALFGSTTPRSNASVAVYAPVDLGEGKTRMEHANVIELPEQWHTGSVSLELEESYGAKDGIQWLESRKLTINRNSDAGPAGVVALGRAEAARDSTDILGTLAGAMVREMIQFRIQDREATMEERLAEIDRMRARDAIEAMGHE